MSILYLQIVDVDSKETIGIYEHVDLKDDKLKKEIEKKCSELISEIKTEITSSKKHLNFKIVNGKKIEIYYLSTNNGTLYLTFLELDDQIEKSFKDSNIFEFLENIESQNLKKLVDDDGKLSKAGQQNLKIAVENYHNTYHLGNESLNDDDLQSHKISVINNHINDVKNDMKENVKNMMTNMQDMNEIEGKSVSIKDSSFQFQKDSKDLENKMRRAALRNKIIIGIVIVAIAGIAIYSLMK
jgi:ribosomal protein S3AE